MKRDKDIMFLCGLSSLVRKRKFITTCWLISSNLGILVLNLFVKGMLIRKIPAYFEKSILLYYTLKSRYNVLTVFPKNIS